MSTLKFNGVTRNAIFGAALVAAVATAGVFFLSKNNSAAAQEASGEDQGPPPAPVAIIEAIETELAPQAEAPGSAVSIADSLVAAATNGKVEWVAEIGDEIAQGETIARLDPADAQMALDEIRTDIGRLKSRADYLNRLVGRYEDLGDDTGEPEAALDEIRANRDEAVQNLKRAEVALARANVTLERTQIKAPFTGRIATREIQVGEFANVGSPIARLVDTTNLEVTARAPANMLANVKAGDTVRIQYQNETLNAVVRAVVPIGDAISRTQEIRVALPDTQVPIGAAVRVQLPAAAPRRAVAAHRDALVLRADGISVYKVNDEDVATRVDVELGAADGDLIEVIGDVAAGDRLVVRGAERLRDGQNVIVQDQSTTPEPVS